MSFHHNLEGLDLHAPSNRTVENNTASTIEVFRAVTFASAGIGTKFIEVRKGDGAIDLLRGVTASSISVSGVGIITMIGTLRGVDTSAFAVGDLLYADASGVLSTAVNGVHIVEVLKVDGTDGIVHVDGLGINSSATGESNTASNIGAGEGIFAAKSGVDLTFKSLIGGSGIDLTSNASEITITASGIIATGSNLSATGASVFAGASAGQLQFRTLIGGSGIALSTTASQITIEACGAAAATGSNLGAGEGIFVTASAGELTFKSLIGGSGVDLTSNASEITITASGIPTTGSNLSVTGEPVFAGASARQLQFKTLVGGSGVDLTSTASQVTITASGIATTGSNLSTTGASVFAGASARQLQFRTLIGGSGIELTVTASQITITASGLETTGSNIGSIGASVLVSTSARQLQFRTIVGASNINASTTASTINLSFGIDGLNLTTVGGQVHLTLVDTTRANKVLSVAVVNYLYAETNVGNNDNIRIGEVPSASVGHIVPFDATIIGVEGLAVNDLGNAKAIDLFVNDVLNTSAIGTFAGASAESTFSDTTLNIDVSAGDKLQLFGDATGGIIEGVVVTLYVKWRG